MEITTALCQSAQLISGKHIERHVAGAAVRGEGGFGIALSQKGKCSDSGMKEGCRVGGRGTLQQLVSIIHGGTAECTAACEYACKALGGGLRPLAPGGEQQVREDEDYKNTSRHLALVLLVHSASVCWIFHGCHRMCVPTAHQSSFCKHPVR